MGDNESKLSNNTSKENSIEDKYKLNNTKSVAKNATTASEVKNNTKTETKNATTAPEVKNSTKMETKNTTAAPKVMVKNSTKTETKNTTTPSEVKNSTAPQETDYLKEFAKNLIGKEVNKEMEEMHIEQ